MRNGERSMEYKHMRNKKNENKSVNKPSISLDEKLKPRFDNIENKLEQIDKLEKLFTDIKDELNDNYQKTNQDMNQIRKMLENYSTSRLLSNTNNALNGIAELQRRKDPSAILNRNLDTLQRQIDKKTNDILYKMLDLVDLVDNANTIQEDIKKAHRLIETNNGTIKQVDQRLTDIYNVLNKENENASQKFPAMVQDEDTLIEMSAYGEEILKQLTLAARWYARSRDKFQEIKQQEEKQQNRIHELYQDAEKKGREAGKKELIQELLSLYEDNSIDSIMKEIKHGTDPQVKVLATFLHNNGLREDEDFLCGKKVLVTEENLQEIQEKVEHAEIGEICITRSCYLLDGMVRVKATFEHIASIEETNQNSDSVDMEEKCLIDCQKQSQEVNINEKDMQKDHEENDVNQTELKQNEKEKEGDSFADQETDKSMTIEPAEKEGQEEQR